jgi:uncharacterized protein
MGYKEIELQLPCGYDERVLEKAVESKVRLHRCSYKILRKSLDSRRKDRIHWKMRIRITSPAIAGPDEPPQTEHLTPVQSKRVFTNKKVIVAGSGPAGIFAASYLQKSGLQVTLLERGKPVDQRKEDIRRLETSGLFTPDSNYTFGEGGAGTFSDGKLTSRSKHIKKEKRYILEEFVRNGAPEEILYLTHPHIGSDNLIRIARNMRESFQEAGGKVLFGTAATDLDIKDGKVRAVQTEKGALKCDIALFATGHSSYDSYRMLMDKGLSFRPKNFALGFRMEHSQEQINRIQWGCPRLPGVKAAEYRLTSGKGELPVYTFCMCPGGKVVPAAAFPDGNIVNGMSLFQRDGAFANAALVAGISLSGLTGRNMSARESLHWLENLERRFADLAPGYKAPAMTIPDFLKGEPRESLKPTSYEPGLVSANLADLFPWAVTHSLREGLDDLCRRLPGFDKGQVMGLESKTSAPIQVLRDRLTGLAEGTENLFICGEASGYSGGIISSASDGLRSALAILSSF